MKIRNRLFAVLLAVLCAALPVLPVAAAETGKEEVVYATLSPEGAVTSLAVVNILPEGSFTDYGPYTAIRNMTTRDALTLQGGVVTGVSTADRLYYEGTLSAETPLPWQITLRYFLNGREITAAEAGGATGALELRIGIARNADAERAFYDGWALQTTVTLDTRLCRNIEAAGATAANVGSNRQLTYTVLPGQGADISVRTDVTGFRMDAITFNAVRMQLSLSLETGSLGEQLTALSGATVLLDDGVKSLQSSLGGLQSGLDTLAGLSGALQGDNAALLASLYTAQRALTDAAARIGSLSALSGDAGDALAELHTLTVGLSDWQRMLTEAAFEQALGASSAAVREENEQAAAALGGVAETLDAWRKTSGGEEASLTALIAAVNRAINCLRDDNARGTAVAGYLTELRETAAGLTDSAAALETRCRALLDTLSSETAELAALGDGLLALENAVSALGGTAAPDSGLPAYGATASAMGDAARQMRGEVMKLSLVSGALRTRTEGFGAVAGEQIGSLLASLTGSNIETVSFASPRNTAISAVQFVIKTTALEAAVTPVAETPPLAPLTFWQKLLRLFGLY